MADRKAVLIGNGDYLPDSRLTSLTGPANDIGRLSEVLSDPDVGAFSLVRPHIDRDNTTCLAAVEAVLRTAKRDDFVLVYYSGHGVLDQRGQLFLASSNTRSDLLISTAVPLILVRQMIEDSPASTVVLILDCCYGGAAEHAFLRGSVDQQFNLFHGSGRHVLTSATSIEVAREREGVEDGQIMGVFTRALVSGITSGDADIDRDGLVSLADAHEYLSDRMTAQRPQLWRFRTSGKIVLARVPSNPPPEQTHDVAALEKHISGLQATFSRELRSSDLHRRRHRLRRRAAISRGLVKVVGALTVALPGTLGWVLAFELDFLPFWLIRSVLVLALVGLSLRFATRRAMARTEGMLDSSFRAADSVETAYRESALFQRLTLAEGWHDLVAAVRSKGDWERIINRWVLDIRDQLAKAKRETAGVIADRRQIDAQIEEEIRQASDWEHRAALALVEDREDLATQAVIRKLEHARRREDLEPLREVAASEEQRVTSYLRTMNDFVEEIKTTRNRVLMADRAASVGAATDEQRAHRDGALYGLLRLMARTIDPSLGAPTPQDEAQAAEAQKERDEVVIRELEQLREQIGPHEEEPDGPAQVDRASDNA